MMLCLDVFSSLSMSLSIASRLAIQTSHPLGSALAFAASPMASSARHSSVRRSIVLGMLYLTISGVVGSNETATATTGGPRVWRVTFLQQVSGRRLAAQALSQRLSEQECICACRVATA